MISEAYNRHDSDQTETATVSLGDPIELTAKLEAGFVIAKVKSGLNKEVHFELIRHRRGETMFDKHQGPLGDIKEVPFSQLQHIDTLLRQGWVGIDIKQADRAERDNPEQWLVILENPIVDIREPRDLLEFFTALRRNPDNNSIPKSNSPEELVEHAFDQTTKHRANAEGYYGIKAEDGRFVAGGSMVIYGSIATLENDFTDAGFRGQQLSQKLTDMRINKAKEHGCDYVDCFVLATNPAGLMTKLHRNFKIRDFIDFTDNKLFYLRRSLRTDAKPQAPLEVSEVPLTELAKIKLMIQSGWVGVDLRNKGAKDEPDPTQWQIIFERETKR